MCVAVHVRPLIASETEEGCQEGCLNVSPDTPQASSPPALLLALLYRCLAPVPPLPGTGSVQPHSR